MNTAVPFLVKQYYLCLNNVDNFRFDTIIVSDLTKKEAIYGQI